MSSLSVSEPESVILVEDLSVTYRANVDRAPTLRNLVTRRDTGPRTRLIEALKGVDLEIQRGTVVGVIGHNGAGKSTLMRAISGIIPPTNGRVTVYGEVTAMLSLGIGFRLDLSGRDNIRLGGLATGLGRDEIELLTDDIIAFAELEQFIDLPMRTYSSGMRSRLAFAVTTQAKPDILLIDEALSAGDARFKVRSSARIKELCAGSATVLIVSHGLATIEQLCDKVLWLGHGQVLGFGDPSDIVGQYSDAVGVNRRDSATQEDV